MKTAASDTRRMRRWGAAFLATIGTAGIGGLFLSVDGPSTSDVRATVTRVAVGTPQRAETAPEAEPPWAPVLRGRGRALRPTRTVEAVSPPPRWAYLDLAAAELADMKLHGCPPERRWADIALADASVELKQAVDSASESEPGTTPARDPAGGGDAAAKLRIDMREFVSGAEVLSDLTGYGGKGGDTSPWPGRPRQSFGACLDEVQVQGLERVAERSPDRLHPFSPQCIEIEYGARTHASACGPCGLLTIQARAVAEDYVDVDVRLRAVLGDTLVFSPFFHTRLRRGGSILLVPADVVSPSAKPPEYRWLILTIGVDPSQRDESRAHPEDESAR